MSKLVICGKNKLEGDISVQGAKNAVLPILAATLLNNGKSVLHNCPKLRDVEVTVDILKALGCKVKCIDDTISVDASGVCEYKIDDTLMRKLRSSIIFLGAIISRLKKAVVSLPGGCEIGSRPIDLHIKAFRQLGIDITEEHGYIICSADKITGAKIHLDFPSVGATENIMLASVYCDGKTVITNAACEPEIYDLQTFLNKMGARISGAGTSVIEIEGVSRLYGVDYRIMPDRIAAATYLACAAATNGNIRLNNANPRHMTAILHTLRDMGNDIETDASTVILSAPKRLTACGSLRTMPYPGFPTDIQSPFAALAAIADGTTVITETIFENRFRNAEELCRMGANIKVDGRCAVVIGTDKLSGANVVANELRGGASLVVAGLAADGVTCIDKAEYIDRGYEDIDSVLMRMGADVSRITDDNRSG